MFQQLVRFYSNPLIANVTPVIIWITKQTANNDPKFHKQLMLLGSDASIIYELTNLNKG